MRLWHVDLIPQLPRQQLLGQHRECYALRGLGWGKKHATVNYVFQHPRARLYHYHVKVMLEMTRRGYKVDKLWLNSAYRGKRLGYDAVEALDYEDYPEHNEAYLRECVGNLREKGIVIDGLILESV